MLKGCAGGESRTRASGGLAPELGRGHPRLCKLWILLDFVDGSVCLEAAGSRGRAWNPKTPASEVTFRGTHELATQYPMLIQDSERTFSSHAQHTARNRGHRLPLPKLPSSARILDGQPAGRWSQPQHMCALAPLARGGGASEHPEGGEQGGRGGTKVDPRGGMPGEEGGTHIVASLWKGNEGEERARVRWEFLPQPRIRMRRGTRAFLIRLWRCGWRRQCGTEREARPAPPLHAEAEATRSSVHAVRLLRWWECLLLRLLPRPRAPG